MTVLREASSILIAFKPSAAGLRGDRLFRAKDYCHFGDASHWLEPTRHLAQYGLSCGIEIHTDDLVDLRDAAVLIFGELPMSRREIERLRREYPHLKLILQIMETPIGRDWAFDPLNHSDFDAVVSYNPILDDKRRYFSFRIPAGGVGSMEIPSGAPWQERKIACLIANVPNVRPIFVRRSGLGMIRNGWRFRPRTWWNYVTEGGSLYRERLCIARQCEDLLGDQFDIFGPGWPKAASGTSHGKGFLSARGAYKGSKLELLQNYRFTIAYENCLNDCGYITEKLFDALLAGCVPVYLGNKSIQKYVPEDIFVDARQFKTRFDLARFIQTVPEELWRSMRDAGSAFLSSEASDPFGSSQYARTVIDAVRQVMFNPLSHVGD
jgi:hypothetical protein